MKNKPLIETTTRVQPIDYFSLHHGQTLHTHQKPMLIQSLLHSALMEEYHMIRQGKEVKVEVQMLLKTGDELSVLSKTGMLHLLQDDGERETMHILTKQNLLFKVPESSAPSGLIHNMIALGKQWFENASKENTLPRTLAPRSLTLRGAEPVLLFGEPDQLSLYRI